MKFQISECFNALAWCPKSIRPFHIGHYQISDKTCSTLSECNLEIDQQINLAYWDGQEWSDFESNFESWRGIEFSPKLHLLNTVFSGTLDSVSGDDYESDIYEIKQLIIRESEISIAVNWISEGSSPQMSVQPLIGKLQDDRTYLVTNFIFSSHSIRSTDNRYWILKINAIDENLIEIDVVEKGWEDEWHYKGELERK